MKFGQLIACNMRNIFIEKLYTKWGEKRVPDPFLKIKTEHISGLIV